MEKEKSPLTVGIDEKMSIGELLLFAIQHLMGITFLLAVPGIIGSACGLNSADIGYMVQSCFIGRICFALRVPWYGRHILDTL